MWKKHAAHLKSAIPEISPMRYRPFWPIFNAECLDYHVKQLLVSNKIHCNKIYIIHVSSNWINYTPTTNSITSSPDHRQYHKKARVKYFDVWQLSRRIWSISIYLFKCLCVTLDRRHSCFFFVVIAEAMTMMKKAEILKVSLISSYF